MEVLILGVYLENPPPTGASKREYSPFLYSLSMVANSKECPSGLKLNGCFLMLRKFLLVSSFSCGVCQEVLILLIDFDPLFSF